MRTVDYSEILHGSAALAGMLAADIGPQEFALFRTFHDRRLQAAWELHRWPEICLVEKRTYRAAWAAGTTYATSTLAAPVEVFDPETEKYFQSLQDDNTGNAPTVAGVENSAYWAECKNAYSATLWTERDFALGDQAQDPATLLNYQCITPHTGSGSMDLGNFGLLTPFDKYIGYTQTGETAIGEYLAAYDKDPRITSQLRKHPFWLSENGAQFGQQAPNVIYLYFRKRRPTLTGDVWDSTAAYALAAQSYYAAVSGGAGNFYACTTATTAGQSPATAPTSWAVVDLPYFLRGYLIEAGYADWLTADGQGDKASVHEMMATQFLELEADKLQRQQQQVQRFQMQ